MRFLALLLLGALALGAQGTNLSERLLDQALLYAQAQAAGLSGSVVIRVLRPPNLPRLPEGLVRFEPTHVSKQDFAGPFFVAFRIFVDQRPVGITRVDLEGKWTGKLLRTRLALPRKAIPTEEQLEEVAFEGTPPPGALMEFPNGYQLKLPVAAGKVLCRADIQPIPLVNIGDTVRLRLVYGSASVSSETVARTAGGLGDRVRLELPNARRAVQAVVTGPGEARIEWVQPGS